MYVVQKPDVDDFDGTIRGRREHQTRGRRHALQNVHRGESGRLQVPQVGAHERVPDVHDAVAGRHQSHALDERQRQDGLLVGGVRPLAIGGAEAVAVAPQRPQLHRLVPAAGHEAVLVVQRVQALDAVRVAGERLQFDLLEVEHGVLLRTADLVLPVGQPVAAQVARRVLHSAAHHAEQVRVYAVRVLRLHVDPIADEGDVAADAAGSRQGLTSGEI